MPPRKKAKAQPARAPLGLGDDFLADLGLDPSDAADLGLGPLPDVAAGLVLPRDPFRGLPCLGRGKMAKFGIQNPRRPPTSRRGCVLNTDLSVRFSQETYKLDTFLADTARVLCS